MNVIGCHECELFPQIYGPSPHNMKLSFRRISFTVLAIHNIHKPTWVPHLVGERC